LVFGLGVGEAGDRWQCSLRGGATRSRGAPALYRVGSRPRRAFASGRQALLLPLARWASCGRVRGVSRRYVGSGRGHAGGRRTGGAGPFLSVPSRCSRSSPSVLTPSPVRLCCVGRFLRAPSTPFLFYLFAPVSLLSYFVTLFRSLFRPPPAIILSSLRYNLIIPAHR
jgi:hypothetical protein